MTMMILMMKKTMKERRKKNRKTDLRSKIQGRLTHTHFEFEYNAKRKSLFQNQNAYKRSLLISSIFFSHTQCIRTVEPATYTCKRTETSTQMTLCAPYKYRMNFRHHHRQHCHCVRMFCMASALFHDRRAKCIKIIYSKAHCTSQQA